MNDLRLSFSMGYACLAAWADLLDRINVFPVADGDTGTNLRISLAPLRNHLETPESICNLITRSATGNSGNIAAAFFREFYQVTDFSDLAPMAERGRACAWQAIANPCRGTMLTIFDSLAATLSTHRDRDAIYPPLRMALQKAVLDTTQQLPDLQKAEVVDSGALAMYVFFDGFFRHFSAWQGQPDSLFDLFAGKLRISSTFSQNPTDCYCVDAVLEMVADAGTAGEKTENRAMFREQLASLGESVVVVEDHSLLKIHVHTADPDRLRGQLGSFGAIVRWSDEAMVQHSQQPYEAPAHRPILHIVTDAAGSLTRAMALRHGITLLDSYIIIGDDSRPESLHAADEIYPPMRRGVKITTAQASTFERQEHYRSICQQFGPSLYLCVGSAFTGNYGAALAWQAKNSLGRLLTVLDTGAASGRLALIALLTARYALTATTPEQLIAFAQRMMAECNEYVFIHELKYLVAGGRVSRAGGFFGDLLHLKPIVSPTSQGVKRLGVVRSSKEQLAFALKQLAGFAPSATPTILLQYSDNEDWVGEMVHQQVETLLPQAEILLTPLSLTSGVHMGPGTWSLAVSPSSFSPSTTASPCR